MSNFAELAKPAQRALANNGVNSLDDLAKFERLDVQQWHGIGPNALKCLDDKLKAAGLQFAAPNKEK